MQFKNPFIDNLSKVMADAFGAAHSAKNEAENVFKTWLDGWLADRDFVTREEFEALKLSVEELRNKDLASINWVIPGQIDDTKDTWLLRLVVKSEYV